MVVDADEAFNAPQLDEPGPGARIRSMARMYGEFCGTNDHRLHIRATAEMESRRLYCLLHGGHALRERREGGCIA